MLNLILLRRPKELLNNDEAKGLFMDLIAFRQKLYQSNSPNILCLDKYDLISSHMLLLYGDQLVACMRVTEYKDCLKSKVPLPIEYSFEEKCSNQKLLHQFLEKQKYAVHMSFLCKDKDYDHYLKNINILDFLTWVAFSLIEAPYQEISYCSTPNTKYNLVPWLKQIGSYVMGQEFIHPSVPEKHDLIFITRISDLYWRDRENKYAWILDSIRIIENDSYRKKVA